MFFSLNNYSDIYKFAASGISETFFAVERSSNRNVVIKKMALDPAHKVSSLEWLEYEARNTSSLTHNNIISIIDHGNDADYFYIVMEHIEGYDFNAFISDASFNYKIGLMIVLKALQTLRIAHNRGIVHCNIKPSNLLISKIGRVVLSDFGLSQSNAHIKEFQNGRGDFTTSLFMPPEQAILAAEQEGHESDIWVKTTSVNETDISTKQARALKEQGMRWDLWSVGVLLYRVCSGCYPFFNDDFTKLFISIKYLDPKKIIQLVTGLPHPIAEMIELCLKKKPYDRPHSLDPVIKVLKQYFDSQGISNIDEKIAAYVRQKMGLPPIPGEPVAVSDDLAANDLSSFKQNESKWDYTENKTIKNGPSRQSVKKLFFSPHSRIALSIVLTTLFVLVVFGTFIIKTHTGKPPQFTSITTSSSANTDASLVEPEVQSANHPIMQVQNSTGMAPKKKPVIKKTATKKPETFSGVLKVKVNPPGAQVFIDGTLITQNEMENGKRVAPGDHKIVAQATDYVPYDQSIRIESNKTRMLTLDLKSYVKGNGQLHIYSYPWANLYVDDELIGTTPTPSPIMLVEGDHVVVLKRDGYQTYNERVVIKKSEVTRLQVQLKKTEEE